MVMLAGYYDEHMHLRSGRISYSPKSLSFGEMDEIEFRECYDSLIDVALEHFIDADAGDLEAAINRLPILGNSPEASPAN